MEINDYQRMIILIWIDLVLHRSLGEETLSMMRNFSPSFMSVSEKEFTIIHYKLQVDEDTSLEARVPWPEDKSNKHMRLDATSPTVNAFLMECRGFLLELLQKEFPAGEVKTSFAYEADKLIRKQTNEDRYEHDD